MQSEDRQRPHTNTKRQNAKDLVSNFIMVFIVAPPYYINDNNVAAQVLTQNLWLTLSLTDDWRRVAAGETQRTITRIYNVSQSTISSFTHSEFAEC